MIVGRGPMCPPTGGPACTRSSTRAGALVAAASVATLATAAASYRQRLVRRVSWVAPEGRHVETSTLTARVLGGDGAPVLLLHGLVGSGLYWGGAYDALAEHHRLVVPDLLGFGRSPRPATGYGPDDHAEAVITCLDDLGVGEPVLVGAHSLGSLVALRLAVTHPERVAGVVAFGPPLYPDAASARDHVTATSPMARLFVLPGPLAERVCTWMCAHRTAGARLARIGNPGLPPAVAADAVQHSWSSYSQTLERVILAADATTWIDDIRCPVHLVAGVDDQVVDHRHLRHVSASHANVWYDERPGRHDLPLTEAACCARLIGRAASAGASALL